MKLSLLSVMALVGLTLAAGSHQHTNTKAKREASNPADEQVWANSFTPFKRQNLRPPLDQPAMTDAEGNVVPYSREGARKVKAKREALALHKRRSESMRKSHARRDAKQHARRHQKRGKSGSRKH